MKITIITATYNRKYLLPKLYKSICKNYKTYKDIEWVIVDDGSEDGTGELVDKWKKEAKFKIDYHYQKNAGKMKAINKGMKYVTGEIVIEIDSDDYLLDDTLRKINEHYENLDNDNVYGILYRRDIVGKDTTEFSKLDGKILRIFDVYNKYDYDFDLALTFKSEIRKKYDYKVEKGEKFITEARTYYKIDQDYDGLLIKKDAIIGCEYMDDGYSKNIDKIFKSNPKGYLEYFKECLGYINKDTLFKKRLYFIKHYILFSYLNKKSMVECIKEAKGLNNKLMVALLVVPGYIKSSRF